MTEPDVMLPAPHSSLGFPLYMAYNIHNFKSRFSLKLVSHNCFWAILVYWNYIGLFPLVWKNTCSKYVFKYDFERHTQMRATKFHHICRYVVRAMSLFRIKFVDNSIDFSQTYLKNAHSTSSVKMKLWQSTIIYNRSTLSSEEIIEDGRFFFTISDIFILHK